MQRISTGWVVFAALVVFLLFTALVLPGQASEADDVAGSAGSPDMSFYYSADQLYQMAESYGEEGRAAYIKARFTFDLIWPVVYLVFLATAISWVNRKAFAADSIWQRANIVPVLGSLWAYLENISTSIVMARYPSPSPAVDVLAGVLTSVKWIFVSGSFVLLLVGVVIGIVRWIRTRDR
jgi:hypothetical protein